MNPKVLLVLNASLGECAAILRGISHYQANHGPWDLFLDGEARAEADADWLMTEAWDGVISRTTTAGLVRRCAQRGLPLVDLNDCAVFPGVPKIRPDNVAIGHMAAEDLHGRGFRHLYFCGYSNQLWSQERRDGFFEALRLLGCEPGEFSLHHGCELPPAENARVVTQIAEWLQTLPRPAGILAAHDLRGAQVLAAARQAGLRVPEELAVLGVNNEEGRCELASPPLSSVATDGFRSGCLAAEELARCLRRLRGWGGEVRVEPLQVVTRRSTDGLAIADRTVARALSLIREHACAGITVPEVMRRAAISRGRLERGLRRYLGRSPQAEIRRVQLTRIKQLLSETDLPLKDIAQQTGFEHVEYLSVSFKREVGETPGSYRRRAQQPPVQGAPGEETVAMLAPGPATAA